MERKVIVVSQYTGSRVEFDSQAITLGDLKEELLNQGMDIPAGSDFKEGKTASTFSEDRAILPTNVTYKGVTSNDLIFVMTPSKRKIESGLSEKRANLYNKVKALGLEDILKDIFNVNFTQVSNDNLEKVIEENTPAETECSCFYKEWLLEELNKLKDNLDSICNYIEELKGVISKTDAKPVEKHPEDEIDWNF